MSRAGTDIFADSADLPPSADAARPIKMLPQISRYGCPPNLNWNKCTLITAFTSERDHWMRSRCINIHDLDSPEYGLSDEYDGRKVVPKDFFMLLDSYQHQPEAKSLGPDGEPCRADTRGLLQRAHIGANWPPIYIGKESDRHWEEGEDLSLLEFRAIQYRRKGYAVATVEERARIAKVPKRKFMRLGVNQHTLQKICLGEPVRTIKLVECLKVLDEYERAHPNVLAAEPSTGAKTSARG